MDEEDILADVESDTVVTVDLDDEHEILLRGDEHFGSATCHVEAMNKSNDWLLDDDAGIQRRAVEMGDLCENITTRDKRFNPEEHVMSVREQYNQAREEYLKPVEEQILLHLTGNHDLKNAGNEGDPIKYDICGPLDITYGTYECKLNVHVGGSLAYKVYLNHGFSSANSKTKHDSFKLTRYYKKRLYDVLCSTRVNDADVMCFDEETEVLTEDGWMLFDELPENPSVATFNRETGQMEYQRPWSVVEKEPEGPMIRYEGQNVDFLVTPDHRFWTRTNGNEKWSWRTALDMIGKSYTIPMAGQFDSEGIDLSDDEVRLIAWILSEGSIRLYETDEGETKTNIRIHQSDTGDSALEELIRIVESCGIAYSFSKKYDGGKEQDGTWRNFDAYRLGLLDNEDVMDRISGFMTLDKEPGDRLWDMNAHQCEVFLEAYALGDGYEQGNGLQISTTSEEIADLVQACSIKAGRRCTLHERERDSGKLQYVLTVNNRSEYTLNPDGWSKEDYDGTVWCLNVPNETLVVRRNGKSFISGNCMGHWHELMAFRPEPRLRLYDDGSELQDSWNRPPIAVSEEGERFVHRDNRWYCCTGSFKRSRADDHPTYPATRGYPPSPIGSVILRYDNGNLVADPVVW